jgi:hypothetical protein
MSAARTVMNQRGLAESVMLTMLYMVQAMSEQIGRVSVEAIKDLSPFFARLHQAHLPQRTHVMRDRRLAQADRIGQYADVLFAGGQY